MRLKVECDSRRVCLLLVLSCHFILGLLEFQSTCMLQLPSSRARRLFRYHEAIYSLCGQCDSLPGTECNGRLVLESRKDSGSRTWTCPSSTLPISTNPFYANLDDDSSRINAYGRRKGALKPAPRETFALSFEDSKLGKTCNKVLELLQV